MKKRNKTQDAAFGGVLVALSIVILYIASILPFAKICLCAIAAAALAVTILKNNIKSGIVAFIAVSIISFILLPDKNIALLYSALLGPYMIVKYFIEPIDRIFICLIIKLIYFNVVSIILLNAASGILQLVPKQFMDNIFLILIFGNIVFIFYDIVLSKIIFYIKKRFKL